MSESETLKANNVQEFSVDLLRIYYARLFPYDAMFNWLSYGNDPAKENEIIDKQFFSQREWSFTIEDDIYIRYQSFKDKNEMMNEIQKRQPHKLDIGAVFTAPPKNHSAIKPELFKPVERELVFDIDMTDYDDIRTCCSGANICMKCWPYMTMAIKVVDRSLREDFAFKNILWVYSGRRGIHCWVCDPSARSLSNEARSAVVDYLSIHTGSTENSDKKIKTTFNQLHPMLKKAYNILEPYFANYIADDKGQGLLARKDRYMKVLNSLPCELIRVELYEAWERDEKLTGAEKWQQLKKAITLQSNTGPSASVNQPKKRKNVNYSELDAWRYELIFTHCYPRLDANVSKAQNHLLKSPFCIHPKTGRVCVPIDPKAADSFNPFTVPTVRSLCDEIDRNEKETSNSPSNDTQATVSDMDKTSMKKALEVFDQSFMKDMWSTIRKDFREKQSQLDAIKGEF